MRAFVKAMVLKPALTDEMKSFVAAVLGLVPGAGFKNKKFFLPRGAPLWSMSSKSRPVSMEASSIGFAIVAELAINTGYEPYSAAIRRSLRRTLAT